MALTENQSIGLENVAVESDRIRVFIWNNLSIIVWIDQADIEAVMAARSLSQKMVARYPRGHSSISFVLDGLEPPPPDVRKALGFSYKTENSGVACMAIVLEGTGFWASTLRGTVTGIKLKARGSVALQLYNSIDEVIAWLPNEHEKRTGVKFDPWQLRSALIAAREQAAPAK